MYARNTVYIIILLISVDAHIVIAVVSVGSNLSESGRPLIAKLYLFVLVCPGVLYQRVAMQGGNWTNQGPMELLAHGAHVTGRMAKDGTSLSSGLLFVIYRNLEPSFDEDVFFFLNKFTSQI